MSGLYPDVPGPRMPYHRDGTVMLTQENLTWTAPSVVSAGTRQVANNESSDVALNIPTWFSATWVCFVFPELRDISGIFTCASVFSDKTITGDNVATSTNTTDGLDGTWTGRANVPVHIAVPSPIYRTNIGAVSYGGVRAIRWRYIANSNDARSLYAVHLYGGPTSGETRFLIWTDTGGTEVTGPYFDFADDPRGGPVEDKTFKIKNGHGTLTANGVVLSTSVLSNKSPSFSDDYTFSSDGSSFSATLNIGDLAPAASSGTLYVRRTTPIGAALGLETGMLMAIATSWT